MSDPRQNSPPQKLKVKEWVTRVEERRSKIVTFLLWAYAFLLVTTVVCFFLEGFHFRGFDLDTGLLKWLGVATIGAIGGLLTITIRASFK